MRAARIHKQQFDNLSSNGCIPIITHSIIKLSSIEVEIHVMTFSKLIHLSSLCMFGVIRFLHGSQKSWENVEIQKRKAGADEFQEP